jgi:hypothetical protein
MRKDAQNPRRPGHEMRPFNPEKDIESLRQALRKLQTRTGLSSERLMYKIENKIGKRLGMSRDTLERFIKGSGRTRKFEDLPIIWSFLQSDDDYRVILDSITGDLFSPVHEVTPEVALSKALNRFFVPPENRTNSFTLEFIRKRFVGQYVMFRQNLYKPNMRRILPNMRRTKEIRASLIDISSTKNESIVTIIEKQDFPSTNFYQLNSGVMFTYGEYIMYLMTGVDVVSSKTGVVHDFYPRAGDKTVDWFKGVLFVASDLAIFPAVKCFCLRNTKQLRTGIISMDDIDEPEVLSYLSNE